MDTKTITLKAAQHNLLSAAEHLHVIECYLENKVSLQRMVGPLPASPQIHINPMLHTKSVINIWRGHKKCTK